MRDKCGQLRVFVLMMAVAVMSLGCGGTDADDVAMGPGDERDDESGQEQAIFPFEPEEDSADGEVTAQGYEDENVDMPDPADDDDWDHRCVRICFKAMWCQDDGEDFPECVARCEDAEYEGFVTDGVLDCIDEADSCLDVRQCEDQIEPCTEVCGVYDQCGYFDEGLGCHQWCAAQIWSGSLGWQSQGCVLDVGRNDLCADIDSCGLGEVEPY